MAITISGSGITSANIADGTITNADINASAGIVGSKLDSDLSTGTLTTTGGSGGVALDVRNGGDLRLYAANNTDNVILYCDDDKRLNLNGTIVGGITQVIQDTKTDTFSTSASGASPATITGLSASITPRTTASKVLVTVSIGFISCNAQNHSSLTLRRGSSDIFIGDAASNRPRSSFGFGTVDVNWVGTSLSLQFVDTPNTTSPTSYSVALGGNGGATMYINRAHRDSDSTNEDGRYASSITLMEIGG
jgi:hypothetical protein